LSSFLVKNVAKTIVCYEPQWIASTVINIIPRWGITNQLAYLNCYHLIMHLKDWPYSF